MCLISLEKILPAGEILQVRGLEVETTPLQASRVRGAGARHRLAAETPIFVVWGRKP